MRGCYLDSVATHVPKANVPATALPMTSAGKIQKFELRQAHLQHFEENSE